MLNKLLAKLGSDALLGLLLGSLVDQAAKAGRAAAVRAATIHQRDLVRINNRVPLDVLDAKRRALAEAAADLAMTLAGDPK